MAFSFHGMAIAFALFLFMFIATAAPQQVSALYVMTAVILVCIAKKNALRKYGPRLALLLSPVLVAAAISTVAGTEPTIEAVNRLIKLIGFACLAVLILSHAIYMPALDRRNVRRIIQLSFFLILIYLVVLTFVLLVLQKFMNLSTTEQATRLPWLLQPLTVLAIVTPIFLASSSASSVLIVLLTLGLLGFLLLTLGALSAFSALVIGVGVFSVAYLLRRIGPVIALMAGAVILVAPLLATPATIDALSAKIGPYLNESSLHRLAIWKYTATEIANAPLFGHGLDTARALPGGSVLVPADYLPAPVQANPEWARLLVSGRAELMPLHPHNGLMQLRLELGWIGVLAIFLVYSGVAYIITSTVQDRTSRAGQLGSFVAVIIVFQLSFGVWQTWWMSTLILTASMGVASRRILHMPNLKGETERF